MKKLLPILVLFLFGAWVNNDYRVDEDRFLFHVVNPSKGNLKMYWKDDAGQRFGSIARLKRNLEAEGKKLRFAMNGGMYLKDRSPQGLFVQNGEVLNSMQEEKEGYGNFFCNPMVYL